MTLKVSALVVSEFDLITQYFAPIGGRDVTIGIGDDAAVIKPPGDETLFTAMATLTDETPYVNADKPAQVGHLALSVALNRMAASGVPARWFTLSLTVPESNHYWLEEFARTLGALAKSEQVQLVGGDTTRGPLCVQVNVLGTTGGPVVGPSGARAGDALYVTGRLGLQASVTLVTSVPTLREIDPGVALRAETPVARNDLTSLVQTKAHAAVSLDMGLPHALRAIITDQDLGATGRVADIPLEPILAHHLGATGFWKPALSLTGDHELLLALPEENTHCLPATYRIGRVTNDGEVEWQWPGRG